MVFYGCCSALLSFDEFIKQELFNHPFVFDSNAIMFYFK